MKAALQALRTDFSGNSNSEAPEIVPISDTFLLQRIPGGSIRIWQEDRHRLGYGAILTLPAIFCVCWVAFMICYPNGIEWIDGKQTAGFGPNLLDFAIWSPILTGVSIAAVAIFRYAIWIMFGIEEWVAGPNRLEIRKTFFGRTKSREYTDSTIEHQINVDNEGSYTCNLLIRPRTAPSLRILRTLYLGNDPDAVRALANEIAQATGWKAEPFRFRNRSDS